MSWKNFSRRDWLKTLGIGGASLLGANLLGSSRSYGINTTLTNVPATEGKRVLRLAQITDVHVQPERGAGDGLTKCLHHLQNLKDAPGLILNTGDCIMDSMHNKEKRVKTQWDLWSKVLKGENSLPIMHALGNHDVWGLNKTKSAVTGDEPLFGKKWALDVLGLEKPYYSFDRAGWHIIMLDSVQPFEDSYRARLDAAQMEWLKRDLDAVRKGVPILVCSHIPIVSPAAVLNDLTEEKTKQDIVIPGGEMHLDSKEIHKALREQGNVKLCLSGHLHILDRAEYDGITYISSCAVSGGWWKGKNLDRFDYGYSLVDLYDNGQFDYTAMTYGWQTVEAAKKVAASQPA